jgi:hypothetical protein
VTGSNRFERAAGVTSFQVQMLPDHPSGQNVGRFKAMPNRNFNVAAAPAEVAASGDTDLLKQIARRILLHPLVARSTQDELTTVDPGRHCRGGNSDSL